jgi:hypothetical protein
MDPLLDCWATPLQIRVVDEPLRDRIAKNDQALRHHREIDIGD